MYKIQNGIEWYGVLSREKHPQWIGWKEIDAIKAHYGVFCECKDNCGEIKYQYDVYIKSNEIVE